VLRGGAGGSSRLEDGAAQGRKFHTKVLKLFLKGSRGQHFFCESGLRRRFLSVLKIRIRIDIVLPDSDGISI
jgi:hypothetical protein